MPHKLKCLRALSGEEMTSKADCYAPLLVPRYFRLVHNGLSMTHLIGYAHWFDWERMGFNTVEAAYARDYQ